jgi:putative DNA primase/helicase
VNTAREIAAALGNARREGRNWRCRCPVHGGCSLALCDGRDRLLVRCWAGCDTRDVLAELRRLHLLGGSACASPARDSADDRSDRERRANLALRLWQGAEDARGSPVARYLAGRRIITIAPPPSLRWAPACRHPSGIDLPAMLARIEDADGALIGVHRTFLEANGAGKAATAPAKAMSGRAAGGAVRLAPGAEMLMIGEGIETSLAAMHATGSPAWAALSTSGLMALVLPSVVRKIIILADHDAHGAGERAARIAAGRWLAEGRRVRIAMPPEVGTDFNDLLVGADNVAA